MSISRTPLNLEEIRSWPKAELHCHLDGSLRLNTMVELTSAQNKTSLLPSTSIEQLETILRAIDDSDTLEAYVSWFRYTSALMQARESLDRIANELAENYACEHGETLERRR